ncbi:hypothetical protein ACW95P_01205 [Candidatus Mycoplasma pogonae]
MKITKKFFFKKSSIFVLSTTPLALSIFSFSAIGYAEGEWHHGENVRDWINANTIYLTYSQKEVFSTKTWEYNRSDAIAVDRLMKEMRELLNSSKNIISNPSNKFYPHYGSADSGLKTDYNTALKEIEERVVTASYDEVNVANVKAQKIRLYTTWNALNGFINEAKQKLETLTNLTRSQKSFYLTNDVFRSIKTLENSKNFDSDKINNIDDNFLNTLNTLYNQMNTLNSVMKQLKDTAIEYNNKKTFLKYTDADDAKKRNFENAITNALNQSSNTSSRNLSSITEWKNNIINTFNALNGEENLKKQKQEVIDKVKEFINNDFSDLTPNEKKNFIDKLDGLDIDNSSESLAVFQSIVNPIEKEANELNILNKEKKELKLKLISNPFNQLNTKTIEAIESRIDAASTPDALNSIELKSRQLANKISSLKAKITEMEALKTNEKYTLASSPGAKNNFDNALNSLQTKVSTDNIYDETIESLDTLISNATSAINNLDGLLNKRKQESRNKLLNSPLNDLNEATKQAINNQINTATTSNALDSLDAKAFNVATEFKKLKDKTNELEPYKNDINYKLADDDKKSKFNDSLIALKEEITKNADILNTPLNTFTNLISAAEAAKNELNGNDNLADLKTEIGKLDNLSSDQKNQAINKISDPTKIDSKTALSEAKTLFNDIDDKIKNAKIAIDAIDNLTSAEKTSFIDKLGKINISDVTAEQAKTKIDDIKLEAKKTAWVNEAVKELAALTHLSTALIEKIKAKLNGFDKTQASEFEINFKTKIDEIVNKAKALNAAYANKIEPKFNEYLSTIGTVKYDEATNQEAQNTNVFNALNELANPNLTKPATLTNSHSISELKIDSKSDAADIPALLDNLTNRVTAVVEKISKAKADLNGETILNAKITAKQKELNDLLNNNREFDSLNIDAKNTIKNTIDNISITKAGLEELNELDHKILAAKDVIKKINDKIAELEKAKTDYPLNFNLADNDKKAKYDKVIDDLKNHLKQNLFDTAKVNAAELTLTEADSLSLNGNENLNAAKDRIDGLTHLSTEQKTQAKAKLKDETKAASKSYLTDNEALFAAINDKLGSAKTTLDGIANLTTLESSSLKNQLGKINISNVTAEEVQKEIDNIILEAKKTSLVNKTVEEVEKLDNLSPALIQKINEALKALDKTNATENEAAFEIKVNSIKNKAIALNAKYKNEIESKFNDYVNTIGTTKYDEADNKNEQNNAVFSALNEIIKPSITKPSELTKGYKINSLKIGSTSVTSDINALLDELSAKASEVARKIETAKTELNGETVLADKISKKKTDLETKLDTTPEFTKLPTSAVTDIKDEINKASSLTELENLETKIDATASAIEQIKQRIEKLNAIKDQANYKLADQEKQAEFDAIIKNLEDHLKQDLFDDAIRTTALSDLGDSTEAIAESKLNGNSNLSTALIAVQALDNLSEEQRRAAETNLKNLGKIDSKDKLTAAKNLFSTIDTKIKAAKNDINSLNHLIQTTKDKAIEDLGKINISDIDEATATAKINEIVTTNTTLNNSLDQEFTKLKEALKQYTTEIGNKKHDVTENLATIDQEVLTALKSVLGDITDTTLGSSFNVDGKKLITNDIDTIKTAVENIYNAFSKLNGDTKIKEVIDKLETEPWNTLNDATKAAIKTASNNVTSYEKLQEVIDQVTQTLTDVATIQTRITQFDEMKNSANYKVANDDLKTTFDTEVTSLRAKFTNDDLFNKSVEIANILKPANDAAGALNGNNNITAAETSIQTLTNLPVATQNTIISELKDLNKTNNKTTLNNLVNKFSAINNFIEVEKNKIKALDHLSPELQNELIADLSNIGDLSQSKADIEAAITAKTANAVAINDEFNVLKTVVANYKEVFSKPEYTEATEDNKTAQNNKVKTALEAVLKDQTYANLEAELTELTTETYKLGTTLVIAKATINNIKDALDSLNGLTKVNEEKEKLRAKVEDASAIYNGLNQVTKNAILDDLNKDETDTKAEITAIDTKATNALNTQTQLQVKIDELKKYQSEDKNYKLASPTEKTAFDEALKKLEEQLVKNLYDDAMQTETTRLIAASEIAKTNLDGNKNIEKAKSDISNLSNLLDTTKTDIKNSLDNINKFGDKATLNAEVAKWTAINEKLEDLKNALKSDAIPPLEHLSQAAKDAFLTKAKTIEDVNANQAVIEAKIAQIKSDAENTNTAYNDLKVAYDTYKSKIPTADYVDATESKKLAANETVQTSLESVLDASTTPGATNDLQGKIQADIDVAKIEEAKVAIERATESLDGDANLDALKTVVKNHTQAGGNFASLSDATKIAINQAVTDANFMADVNDVKNKAEEALNTLKIIEEEIAKLEAAKETTNYKVAEVAKQKALDDALKALKDLKDSNLIDHTTSAKLAQAKINAATAIANLDGNKNFKSAQDKVDSFIHIPVTERNNARDNLPTTSLNDLNQKVKDLEEINKTVEKNKDIIDKLPNLNQDTKNELKEESANVDLSKTKNENIDNSNSVAEKAKNLNDRFVKFELNLDDYLSIKQTPTFTAATNKVEQDKKIIDLINSILSTSVSDVSQVKSSNTFKHGIDATQVDTVLAAIQIAIQALDGNSEVEKAKINLIEQITNNNEYQDLSHLTKESLKEKVLAIDSNKTDWKIQLNEIINEATKILTTITTINNEIELAKAEGEINKVIELQETKEADLTNAVTNLEPEISQSLVNSSTNKLYWLFSLLAIIPIAIFWFIFGKRRKNKKR